MKPGRQGTFGVPVFADFRIFDRVRPSCHALTLFRNGLKPQMTNQGGKLGFKQEISTIFIVFIQF